MNPIEFNSVEIVLEQIIWISIEMLRSLFHTHECVWLKHVRWCFNRRRSLTSTQSGHKESMCMCSMFRVGYVMSVRYLYWIFSLICVRVWVGWESTGFVQLFLLLLDSDIFVKKTQAACVQLYALYLSIAQRQLLPCAYTTLLFCFAPFAIHPKYCNKISIHCLPLSNYRNNQRHATQISQVQVEID